MTEDDQRARETVQAELRRRRAALDRIEDRVADNPRGFRPDAEDRRGPLRPQWSLRSATTRG